MCSCDRVFGTQYLPHQISEGKDIRTRERIPITLGFQTKICNACRGLPEKPYPKKPTYGNTSKLRRYYWREIQKATIEYFAEWAKQHSNHTDWLTAVDTQKDQYKKCRQQAISEIKQLHKRSPKYTYSDKSQQEVIRDYCVPVIDLKGVYRPGPDGKPLLQSGGELLTPECFVANHLREQGFEILFTESIPFHVLFGTMMWLVIQDSTDPRIQMVMFGDRCAFDEKRQGDTIRTLRPEDFGSPGYSARRADAIRAHLTSLPTDTADLLWTFDYWVGPSASLRQYLWAHRPHDVVTARRLISILPGHTIIQILEYLIGDYWGRYCGWPDLLAYKKSEFCFMEVKSSTDKLSEDQKNWIEGNYEKLKLPFKLIKIHRKSEL